MATGEPKSRWSGDLQNRAKVLSRKVHLAYDGKAEEAAILARQSAGIVTLWNPDTNTNDNRLYFGENASILATLLYDPSVRRKVDLIYIDPPFSTNSVFKSRAGKDAYEDLHTGPDFVEFLRERLVLLRELLSEHGSIYVHLDQNMVFHMKIIMDEVFGESNFRTFITRRKSNPKNYTRNTYGNISDHILFYTRTGKYIWNRAYRPWTEERADEEYPYVDEESGRRFKKVPIHAPGVRNGDTGKPWKGMNPPPGKHWQYRRAILDEMDSRGDIYWSPTGNPRRKVYLDESKGIPVQDIWLDVKDAHNQNIKITGYPTEKPLNLLERILLASSNPGSLVLDCFSGSGTTLDVASKSGRRWLGIDRSCEAIRTTLDRFKNGLQPMGDYVNRTVASTQQQLPLEIEANQRLLPFNFESTESSQTSLHPDFSLYATSGYNGELDDFLPS